MKRKMQQRVIAVVMTLLMTIGLLPADFLGGEVIEVQAAGNVYTLDMADVPDMAANDADYTTGIFTLAMGGKGTVSASSKTFTEDGFAATKRFSTGGTMNSSGRWLKFTTNAAATVKVWWVCGGDGRQVQITDTTLNQVTVTNIASTVKNTDYVSTLSLSEAGTYLLGSNTGGGMYIYKIEITEADTGTAVDASIQYDSSEISVLSGGWAAGSNTLAFSTTPVSFAAVPEDSRLSVVAGTGDVLGGTYTATVDTANGVINVYNTNVNAGATVIASLPYTVAGQLSVMQIGDSVSSDFRTSIFGSTDLSADTYMSADNRIQMTVGSGTTLDALDGTHGLQFGQAGGSSITFTMKIAANSMGVVKLNECFYSGSATVDVVAGGNNVVSGVSANGATDGDEVTVYEYRNTTSSAQELVVTVNGGSKSFVHGISCEVKEIPQEATVTGSVSTEVAGGTLTFAAGSSYTTTVQADGTYSIVLPIGASYNVELSGVAGYRLDNASVDLTSAAMGSTVANQNFDVLFWDATKTATVTVGGTTYTITPGATENDAFSVVASGGNGNVEIAGSAKAVVWANLGGAGNGSVSGVTYGNGATGTVSGNKITVSFANTTTLPASYVLEVKDNSATGVPVQDGSTNSYNLGNESVVSSLYADSAKLSGGNTIVSTDKLVTLTGNTGIYYNGTTHGIYISNNDTISVKVAGNAEVTFAMCAHSKSDATITASAPTGNVYLSTDNTANATNMLVGTDGETVTFNYEGDATTLTFTVSSPSGTSYIHSLSVKNEAPQTTTNESAVTVKPEILTNIGAPGNLVVTPNGQVLNLKQTGGSLPTSNEGLSTTFAAKGVSFYAFPETADWNKLTLEVKVNSMAANSNYNGVFVGAINDSAAGYEAAVATAGVRNVTGLRGIYTKAAEYAGAGQANTAVAEGETIKYTIEKKDDNFYIISEWSTGSHTGKYKYGDTGFQAFLADGSDTVVYYGLMLAGVDADVMNMVYYDKNGNVLYDQNAYYNPIGEAPVAATVTATAADDRTKIDVNWTGTATFGDGKYVLQVSKDGGAWTDVSDTLTGFSYEYPVSSDASGTYKFRVCGTLGNSDEQSVNNRNTYVVSNEATIEAALAAPTITLNITSPANKVTLSWTKSTGATSYEVYRRSADEAVATKIATVTETSYVDTNVTAEVPYYYYVIAKSANNNSNPQEEVWTLPTAGHTGEYQYDDATIAITKKSYDTVFTDKVTIEGLVTAPGEVSVEVNGTVVSTTTVSEANGTFSFEDVTIAEGRNDVVVYLKYDGNKITRKPLNFVYLTNYDYVVDAAFTGTAGDTTEYGVPQYATVNEAINAAKAAGTSSNARKVIFVREGSYEERLVVDTPYISLIGEDSKKTIIHNFPGNVGDQGGGMTARCAMHIQTGATGFSAENLTFENDWEYKGDGSISNESADVILSEAEGAMYVNVRFLGYQDTICANKNHQYYYKCYITGNVDFIYGNNGMALFNDCDIVFRYNANKNSGYVTAMKTTAESPYGALFNECRITGESGCSGTKYYLGRPWGEYASTVFIDCYMSGVINRNIGWTTWSGKDFSTDEAAFAKVRYYEHGSYGAGYAITQSRRQLSDTQAASMLSASGLGWDPYSNTATVSTNFYIGNKSTAADDKVVEETYNSDVYSAYEGDDTGLGKYNLEGYAQSAQTTGGGLLKETNSNYYAVSTAEEFLDALVAIKAKGTAAVIEIKGDLNLGNLEVEDFASYKDVIVAHNAPLTHPELLTSGVSRVVLKGINDLTIFSSNGSSINHASFDIQGSNNIIIRNIVFDELWEWDEATNGDYDVNDWDYIVVQNGSDRIWIDHCTFYKAYDGIVDVKTNTTANDSNVTVSWCEFLPGSQNDTFFNAMMDAMAANPDKYPYYKSLLDSGMTEEQIWWYAYGQKKTHLLGQSDDATQNVGLKVTLANNYYYNSMDRMPRLRFGDSHVYNCVMDAQELYDARMSIANEEAAKHIVSNGAASTCNGQLLVENSYISGIMNALNSGNGSSPSGYINAVNSLYYMDGTRYALTPKVNTTKPGEVVKILDADTFVENLPYSNYALYDAAELYSVVVPYAGAGKLNLTVLQWEKGAYKDSTWTVPEDDSDYDNEELPEYVETTDGIVVIGEGVAVGVPAGTTFKDSEGNVIKGGKLYVKAVVQEKSSLKDKIYIPSDGDVQYYDVTLVDENGNKVTIASGELTLIFKYPAGTNKSDYSFRVYHGLDNNKVEQLGTSCIDTGVLVRVKSLSPFAIVYAEDTDDGYNGDTVASVPTGDKTPIAPLAVIMLVSAGVCVSFLFKKRKNA